MHFRPASPCLSLPSRRLAGLGPYISSAPAATVNLAPLAFRGVQHPHPSQHLPQWSVVHLDSSKLIMVVQLLSGCTAQQVPLSHIRRAARVKLQEGLQHNTRRVYQGKQRMFQAFCSQYQLQAFPASEETLMVYITYLDEHLKWHYATIQHHLVAICSVHIALGMQNPLVNCPRLHQLLCATRRQQPLPQPDSGQQGITLAFLHSARPLHHLNSPRDKVLWAALTMGHYGLFCSGELAQPKLAEAGTPCFIRVQDVTPHFSAGQLQYVWVFLASSKTDHFHQGCPVIIGCTRTPICRACKAWYLLQQHQHMGSSQEAPFFKINDRARDRVTLVNHIKHLATSLGLDSSRYSGHSLCIGGATSATQAGLSQWQIKLLGQWDSQAYQTYIKQDPLACVDLAARMAANS